jgi:hypothetical protein
LDLAHPVLIKTHSAPEDVNFKIVTNEIMALSKIAAKIQGVPFDKFYKEYSDILKKKSNDYEFIRGFTGPGRVLAAFDPRTRKCKPLKHGLSNRQVILVTIDKVYRNNFNFCFEVPIYESYQEIFPTTGWLMGLSMQYVEFPLYDVMIMQKPQVHYSELKFVTFQGIDWRPKFENRAQMGGGEKQNDVPDCMTESEFSRFARKVDEMFFGQLKFGEFEEELRESMF